MNWVVIIIGILLSFVAVFAANLIFIFALHPIILILFIIVAVIGIISYKEYDNIFEFGSLFRIGFIVSLIVLILLEVFLWNDIIVPVIVKSALFYTEQIKSYVQNGGMPKLLIAAIITIEEPIIIGLLFPLVFEGIHMSLIYIIAFIDSLRQRHFKNKYIHMCLAFVLDSAVPIYEAQILNIIPNDKKYQLKDNLLYDLKRRTYFDPQKNLYWGAKAFSKMKENIEHVLLNTSPKPLEWLLDNVSGYEAGEYIAFKITAIRELVNEKIFILETTTGGSLNSDGEETALYRHYRGSKIKSVVLEDDPDFY